MGMGMGMGMGARSGGRATQCWRRRSPPGCPSRGPGGGRGARGPRASPPQRAQGGMGEGERPPRPGAGRGAAAEWRKRKRRRRKRRPVTPPAPPAAQASSGRRRTALPAVGGGSQAPAIPAARGRECSHQEGEGRLGRCGPLRNFRAREQRSVPRARVAAQTGAPEPERIDLLPHLGGAEPGWGHGAWPRGQDRERTIREADQRMPEVEGDRDGPRGGR